jgi:D-lactate dehydrogenase (cytochrome)
MAEMMMRAHPETSHRVIDVAVPISAYPEIIELARDEISNAGLPAYILSHAGDGNLHITFQLEKDDEKEHAMFEGVNQRIVSKALSLGGTATGEHGVGIGKRKFMEEEHGASLELMKKLKKTLDPAGILNPGKMFL